MVSNSATPENQHLNSQMDPLTQGVLGGLVAQARCHPRHLGRACVIGALAGMAPDLDVLIRSDSDPLLALEYHRHFTHSLFFIPFGALLCSLILYPLQRRYWQIGFRQVYLWCVLGYATHGLLDACTSYGTQLLWPFSDRRFAWDTISVIDPLFTLPLLIGVWLASRRQSRRWVCIAGLWGCLYMMVGVVQHMRAIDLGRQLAMERGHTPLRLEAKPSFANLAVWKLIYTTSDRFYVAAVKPGLGRTGIWPGASIARLKIERDLPWLQARSRQARDLERFTWFSGGYVALHPLDPNRVIDIRYSMLPDQIRPLWGIQLNPQAGPDKPADYYAQRSNGREALPQLLGMILH